MRGANRSARARVVTDRPTIMSLRRRLGLRTATALVAKERWYQALAWMLGKQTRDFVYSLRPAGRGLRLSCRAGTSDRAVFEQVFGEDQYSVEPSSPAPEFIVDCGANVGHTTAHFLERFRNAKVIAIEPDEGNVRLLRFNTAQFGSRVEVMRAALWSHAAGLTLVREAGQADWEIAVRESRPGEVSDVMGVDLVTLISRSPQGRIDILKMDIEGAETTVFRGGVDRWIDAIGLLMVELHDSSARVAFQDAMRGRPFVISESGEVTIARRHQWPPLMTGR